MTQFKNLIFDIGNVIVDIDYAVPVREFQKLAVTDFSEIVSYSKQHHIFDAFEKGQITEQAFHSELRKFLRPGVTDEQILAAWNSILLRYPKPKFDLLLELKKSYKVFALSNINETHVRAIDEAVRQQFGATAFADYFHTAYYSNEVGFRKPEPEIYTMVLEKENLNPAETFFVDDKPENVEAARKTGLKAFELKHPDELFSLLKELNIV
ncbi:MAG: HAD family phosphatase [Chitinophagales bacterium]|nr:HAD family phosphatase [Chitinophagales bacterium]